MESPWHSYGWLFPQAKKLLRRKGVKFLKCYNCMKGGIRYKISGLATNLDLEDQFEEICENIGGICSRTQLPHVSIRPMVDQFGEIIAFPTSGEAEYPEGMTQGIAVGCWRFLKMCPNLAGSCQFDFLEIFSGPNAPTTAAVVKILGRARSLDCG